MTARDTVIRQTLLLSTLALLAGCGADCDPNRNLNGNGRGFVTFTTMDGRVYRIEAVEGATAEDVSLALDAIAPGRTVLLGVGPEGGLDDEETRAATSAGWEPIDLGRRTLRIETAAVLLVAMVTQRLV